MNPPAAMASPGVIPKASEWRAMDSVACGPSWKSLIMVKLAFRPTAEPSACKKRAAARTPNELAA